MITRLNAAAHLDGLADLLNDAVDSGASLGFVKPFEVSQARHWWSQHIDDPATIIWVASEDGRIAGTIGLELSVKANGRHRGEITKLMVHRDFRGRGLGRQLLDTAEREAVTAGLTLLFLDTQTGSAAEHLYRSTGWTPAGSIPAFAADPDGKLWPTTFFFKQFAR
jgi:GNAT superfamily N-acetyltransferase